MFILSGDFPSIADNSNLAPLIPPRGHVVAGTLPLRLPRKDAPTAPLAGEPLGHETVPGMRIVAHYGLVQGSTIRAKHAGRDIMAGLKNLVGGELKGYTELLLESRRQATDRMIAQTEELGGNAVINVRFSTASVTQGAAEILAYGTAVRVE